MADNKDYGFTKAQQEAIIKEWEVQGNTAPRQHGSTEGWFSRLGILAFARQLWNMAKNEPRQVLIGDTAEGQKPCPFCGSLDIFYAEENGRAAIVCNTCDAEGPGCRGTDDESAVLQKWNKRVPDNEWSVECWIPNAKNWTHFELRRTPKGCDAGIESAFGIKN